MSSVPLATGFFSICWMSLARRLARGPPRRLIPTRTRSSVPLFFSTIWCASRTSVRSTSEADMIRPFSRRLGSRDADSAFMVFGMIADDLPARQPCQEFRLVRTGQKFTQGGLMFVSLVALLVRLAFHRRRRAQHGSGSVLHRSGVRKWFSLFLFGHASV